jgi:hypothetical protein
VKVGALTIRIPKKSLQHHKEVQGMILIVKNAPRKEIHLKVSVVVSVKIVDLEAVMIIGMTGDAVTVNGDHANRMASVPASRFLERGSHMHVRWVRWRSVCRNLRLTRFKIEKTHFSAKVSHPILLNLQMVQGNLRVSCVMEITGLLVPLMKNAEK